MSPLASSGRAIGYLISPASWIAFAASFISAKVVGGFRPSSSKTSLRYAMISICACIGRPYSLPS